MANQALNQASRVLIAATLTALLSACGSARYGNQPTVLTQDPVQANNRFGSSGSVDGNVNYNGAFPTALVPDGQLNPDAPNTYEVVEGDTLWDISGRFLNSAWLWPQIWDYNPQIQNPHLIYPGDQISVTYVNGRPSLTLTRDGENIASGTGRAGSASSGNALRVSPRIRVESLANAVPTIPADAIQQFLVRPNVVTNSQLRRSPYVVGNADNRLISSLGQQIFVRGTVDHSMTRFGIYRKTDTLRDPRTGRVLGTEVIHVAEAKLLNVGDPSTMIITENSREVIAGDLLLPSANDGFAKSYTPRLPALEGEGRIVSLVDAISQSGRDQIVTINLGKNVGIEVGDVLAIEAHGETLIDRHGRRNFDRISMPNQRTGVLMVFQTFDDVSYALVMESTRPIRKNDIIAGI